LKASETSLSRLKASETSAPAAIGTVASVLLTDTAKYESYHKYPSLGTLHFVGTADTMIAEVARTIRLDLR
jgi:hypothetical protein